jgi:ankyrin repeat protein
MENNDDITISYSKNGSNPDPWRNYRIVVGILTAAVPLLFGYILYLIQMILAVFQGVIALFSMSNMGGRPPSISQDPDPGIIIFTAFCFLVFAIAGYRFAKNSANSRLIIWIAAILSIPLGIFSIWVLARTAPETHHAPPDKRIVTVVIAGIAVFSIVVFGPIVATNVKEHMSRLERLDSEFIQLIDKNNVEELRRLLEQGADPNQTTKLGTTALMFALEQGHSDVRLRISESAALLVEFGADPNTPSRWQRDAEYEALVSRMRDDEGLMRWLDFDKLKWGYRKHTPLVIASQRGDIALVKLMIEKGADVNAHQTNREVENTLTKLLIEKGARGRYNADDQAELSPLGTALLAALRSEQLGLGVVHVLLSHGVTLDPDEHSVIEQAFARKVRDRPWEFNTEVRAEIERILSTQRHSKK